MKQTISKKRERLFDKLREIYYDFDSIRRHYWTEHAYNQKLRNEAELRQTYVWAFRDVEWCMTIEWLEIAVRRSQEVYERMQKEIKKEEAK